ncbi:MAG: hypothetical protein LBD99_01260 [Candidatus Margulisbacteria bacterium]|jgi:hypothetical protein|nr:hypothetical protein [Candidatus Margulisiibacteriota bacterium]
MANTGESTMVYQLILNPREKMPVKQADAKRFAHMVQREMEDLMAKIASEEKEIEIDGRVIDKTSTLGAMIINDKLSQLEAENTQNFSLLSAIQRSEDSLRQILG